jgi:class 3 adenylate cyclase
MQTATGDGELGRERRLLTVMFCDVVGSTGLSGRQDVEEYFSVLRSYYDACGPVVERHNGVIAQHQGDGIFVWFGYPEAHDDDAIRAVRAGLDLLVVLRALSEDLERAGGERLSVRIAAHAGDVLVAPVRGERKPTAFGYTPNVAAKLQQSARPGSLVISDAVRRLTADRFELVPFESPRLADGSVIDAFEVVGERRWRGSQRRWKTPLIGRQGEFGRLSIAWDEARQGAARTVVLRGERGIGKTRLASALAAVAEASDATVLEGACHPLDSGSAYRLFRTLLSQAAGIDPADPPVVAAAVLRVHLVDRLGMDGSATAVLGQVVGVPADLTGEPVDLDPARLAQVTGSLLVEWASRVASVAPTLLVVEDVADADPSSLGVLGQIAAAAVPALMLVCTARSDREVPPLHAEVDVIAVEALSPSCAEELVAAIESSSPIDPARRRAVLDLGEGVPLYLEELARAAVESDPAESRPITLAGRLQVRLGAPGVDGEIVGVLAAAGQSVDESTIAAVLDVSLAEVQRRLAGLLAADLAVVGYAASTVRVRHGLIAEAAYSTLMHEQRAWLHGRLADVLREQGRSGQAVDWSVIGRHLERAGRPLEAYEALLAGADRARRAGAIAEAVGAYTEALEIVESSIDPGVRDRLEVRCRLQRGIAAFSAGGFGSHDAVEDFSRCAELCQTSVPRPEHLSAWSGVYTFYLLQGELAQARAIVDDLRTWVRTGHIDHQPQNDLGYGVLSFYAGNYEDAVDELSRATQHTGETVVARSPEQDWLLPFDPFVMGLAHLAPILWIVGRPRASHQAADRAIALAATLPFPEGPYSMALAKSFLAWTYALGGHHEAAALLSAEVRDIGKRHGFAFWESTGEIHLALSEYWLGRRPDALETVMLHSSIWEMLRARVFLPYVSTAAAAVGADIGSVSEATTALDAVAVLARTTGCRFYDAERLRLHAAVLPPERAAEAAVLREEAWQLAADQGALVFALRAALDLVRAGAPGSADRLASAVAKFPAGAGYRELNEANALLAGAPS